MSNEIVTCPGKTFVCHIKVHSVPASTPHKSPRKSADGGAAPAGGGGGGKERHGNGHGNGHDAPQLPSASAKLSGPARVTSGPALQRASNASAVIRVTSLGGGGGKSGRHHHHNHQGHHGGGGGGGHHGRGSAGHGPHHPGLAQGVAAGGFADLQHLGLDCVYVGQCWLDTGIALVGNRQVSFRLYCQRESSNAMDQQNSLVVRIGNGGRMRTIKDGDCLIKLRARIEVSKKGHTHWTAIDCVCVITKSPEPVLVSCGVAVLKRHPSTGKCMIAMKRCGQSIGFVSMRRQLKRYFSALAAYREPLVAPQDIAAHFDMCCDFELELLSKPMTASNIKCLFECRSSGPITYNEAWTSMFEKHQMFRIPALTVLEVYARMSLQRRTDSLEDLRRPWTLPKGNFRHMAASGFQTAGQCAVRELKAETGLEWSVEASAAAPSVSVPLCDSPAAAERFFLWRGDALPESGGQVGEKYWQWFEFDEARRRSTTAAAILATAECHKLMGLKEGRAAVIAVPVAVASPEATSSPAADDDVVAGEQPATSDGVAAASSPSTRTRESESTDEPAEKDGVDVKEAGEVDGEKALLAERESEDDGKTEGSKPETSCDEPQEPFSVDDLPSPKKDFSADDLPSLDDLPSPKKDFSVDDLPSPKKDFKEMLEECPALITDMLSAKPGNHTSNNSSSSGNNNSNSSSSSSSSSNMSASEQARCLSKLSAISEEAEDDDASGVE